MEYPLIFLGGVLGSAHCVGMCGGFAITLGSGGHRLPTAFARQLVYHLGRVSTYLLAGAMLGFLGYRLGLEARHLVPWQSLLSFLAGFLLVMEGCFSAGWVRRPGSQKGFCPGAQAFARLLRLPNLSAVWVAGMANGLLPCGLVYAYLALASSTQDLGRGALTMALFGLGTLPALVLTGLAGSLVNLGFRKRLFQIAAYCMILTGVLTLGRAIYFWNQPGSEITCPACAE